MFSHVIAVVALAAATSSPLAVVKNADVEVQKVLKAPDPTVDKLASKADEYVDFIELAKRALGEQWTKVSKAQQAEFSNTMKGLLRASYAQKAISDSRGEAKFDYGEEKVAGNEATVNTSLVSANDKVPVIYKLYRPTANGTWKIYDVVTDDVSLVATYNDQFRQVIAKKGFPGLLSSLKAKRDQLEKKVVTQK